MIKIIKNGKTQEQENKTYTITCEHCGCVFTCQNEDFYKIEKCIDGKAYIKCPHCNNEIAYIRK